MQKRKENNKNWLTITGFLIMILGVVVIGIRVIPIIIAKGNEKSALHDFYQEENKEQDKIFHTESDNKSENNFDYIAVIKIPKIKLEKGLVSKKSKYNSIDYGIQILNESDMPDVINGNFVLAAHSGTASISVFNDLDKLDKDDIVEVLYNKKIYRYKIVKMYDVPKNGTVNVYRNYKKTSITLITCRNNTNNQIVLIGELQI